MNIVVDTNIVFSAILRGESNIGNIIFGSRAIKFYAPDFLKQEIFNHKPKLQRHLRLASQSLDELIHLVLSRVDFFNEELIPQRHWQAALKLVEAIDQDDAPFIALSLYKKAVLWTGDKRLIEAVKKQKRLKVVTTQELLAKTRK
jgi:putative PIN family toxin of toxin-antitoxin system